MTEFFKLCWRKESTEEVLGRGLAEEEGKGQAPGCTLVDATVFHYNVISTDHSRDGLYLIL